MATSNFIEENSEATFSLREDDFEASEDGFGWKERRSAVKQIDWLRIRSLSKFIWFLNHKPIFFTSFQIFQHFPRIEDPSENVGHVEMQPFLSFFRQLRVLFRHVVVFVAQSDSLKALWGSKQKKVKFGNRPYGFLHRFYFDVMNCKIISYLTSN